MTLRWMKHPKTNEPDMTATISVIVVLVCSLKFLFEGVELNIGGHSISLGHADAATYAALLAPVLGVHGWKERIIRNAPAVPVKGTASVDSPDGN